MRGLRDSHRNMDNIRHTDCASRVFNLLDLTASLAEDGERGGVEPFFAHPGLNAAIILKHRLRTDERHLFTPDRTVATKIFLPFNDNDLGHGGRFVFIGERGWQQTYKDLFGLDSRATEVATRRDLEILDIFDELPSLDPFIVRERLKLGGITPCLDYFRLPDADYAAIREGVEREFLGLARPELRQAYRTRRGLGRIVRMMWDCRDPAVVGPLLESLSISADEFAEVMFAWKGFIYYKSLLPALARSWTQVRRQIAAARIFGASWTCRGDDLGNLRERVLVQMQDELTIALGNIRLYDQAYREGLLERREPGIFRAFLSQAAEMFLQLGSAIAAVQHATTFWRYRFGNPATPGCAAEEFHDILTDFSAGLGAMPSERQRPTPQQRLAIGASS